MKILFLYSKATIKLSLRQLVAVCPRHSRPSKKHIFWVPEFFFIFFQKQDFFSGKEFVLWVLADPRIKLFQLFDGPSHHIVIHRMEMVMCQLRS